MPTAPLYDKDGRRIGEVELNAALFGREANPALLHQAVVAQQARQRRGTHSTKTIGEVSGGGVKPWRQKGTGRARHGSRRSPLWPGGATLFGPKPRDYGYSIPRKARRLALAGALSVKAARDAVVVVEGFGIDEPRTTEFKTKIEGLKLPGRKTLIVTPSRDETLEKSGRNVPGIEFIQAPCLNVVDVLDADSLVFTRDGLARAEEVFG